MKGPDNSKTKSHLNSLLKKLDISDEEKKQLENEIVIPVLQLRQLEKKTKQKCQTTTSRTNFKKKRKTKS